MWSHIGHCNSPLGSGLNGLFPHKPFLVIQRSSQSTQHSGPERQHLQTSRSNGWLSKKALNISRPPSLSQWKDLLEETNRRLYLMYRKQWDSADALQRGNPDTLEKRSRLVLTSHQVHWWMELATKTTGLHFHLCHSGNQANVQQ